MGASAFLRTLAMGLIAALAGYFLGDLLEGIPAAVMAMVCCGLGLVLGLLLAPVQVRDFHMRLRPEAGYRIVHLDGEEQAHSLGLHEDLDDAKEAARRFGKRTPGHYEIYGADGHITILSD